jgi:16S rRNA (guanine527-N7)-methyltransferase
VELILPFCRVDGRCIVQKKGEVEHEVNSAKWAVSILGGKLTQIRRIELEEFSDARYLVIIDKILATPDRYPRRAGLPKRRPIRAVEIRNDMTDELKGVARDGEEREKSL